MSTLAPRRGMATIWFVIVGVALAGLFALALDTAHYYLAFHQLQVAADSSALAALDYLPDNQPKSRTQAVNIANRHLCDSKSVVLLSNDGNGAGGDIVLGTFDFKSKLFTPTTFKPTASKVRANRTDSGHGGPVKLLHQVLEALA